MKKIILLLALGISFLNAEKLEEITYYSLGAYEVSYIDEVGKEKALKNIEKAKESSLFMKAYNTLNIRIRQTKNKKPNHPDYKIILEDLKKSHTVYGNWVGLGLSVLLKNKITTKKDITNYPLYFSKELIKENYCRGYLLKGSYIGKLGATKMEQAKIWSDGANSKCSGSKFEKFYLIARRNAAQR